MNRSVAALVLAFVICPIVVCAPELSAIKLPAPDLQHPGTLMQALQRRCSSRAFADKELPRQVLSNLLWAAFGVNRPASGKRTAPSAVNWQEIDIYVAMASGLYLYNVKEHMLDPVLDKDVREAAGRQAFTQQAPVNLIYVADFARMGRARAKDKEFYSATDTGFISQNVYLYCAADGLATVVLGMVDRQALAQIMGLRSDQRIILTQPVGYPKT